MKPTLLLLFALLLSFTAPAQHSVALRNLWARPQVHVLFHGYTVSFTIRDINRAMELLREAGDSTYPAACGLDTAGSYVVELYAGLRQQYRNQTAALLQLGVGAYLLTGGHAEVTSPRHKRLKEIIADIQSPLDGAEQATIQFFDARTGIMLFEGTMPENMYKRDMGIDYY